jgi:hypothetical protein
MNLFQKAFQTIVPYGNFSEQVLTKLGPLIIVNLINTLI